MRHHSGARQWRVACETCGKPRSDRKRMHSQVSTSNLSFFISEDRVDDDLDEDDLRSRLDRATHRDKALVVCNNCGTIREVSK